jgi:hypothetical protein
MPQNLCAREQVSYCVAKQEEIDVHHTQEDTQGHGHKSERRGEGEQKDGKWRRDKKAEGAQNENLTITLNQSRGGWNTQKNEQIHINHTQEGSSHVH